MYIGQPGDITIEVNGGGGVVNAWIDFNKDMTWDSSEQICWWFLPDGTHTITFIVPDDAALGQTFARFRISVEGMLPPRGSALSGEVEDYTVKIYENCGQCTGMEFIRGDANNDGVVDDADVTLITEYALTGAPKPKCMDAADADDNGIVDIVDATFILHYLNGGPVIPQPFPNCGPDPTNDTLTCNQYDYCPGCTTTTRYAKWFQLPDVTENGIDIRVDSNDGSIRTLADDFECRFESLLTDVHFWGSWKNDIRGIIEKIHLSIHYDDPAGLPGYDPNNLFSKPEPDVLWEMDFLPSQFKETLYYTLHEPGEWWWDPVNGELTEGGDKQIWRIDIDIDPNMAFLQSGSIDNPRIYWLDVRVDANNGEFGWKTRRWPDHFMDDAVWDVGSELPRIWKELRYPKGHPYEGLEKDSIDMAFCLTYTPENIDKPTIMPSNPTQCPVVATRCPTVATRCPLSQTQCPVVITKCPALETQCVAITTCPPTETSCPVAPTQCPITLTECPVYETRCPPTETKCVAITMCPPTETSCPIAPTQCPITLTECPVYETRCPAQQTECPPTETECQVVTTLCPRSYTYCPPTETECTVVDTQCPPEDTKCPIDQTVCPVYQTRCPPMETQCQLITMCPPTETTCPAVYTKCPTISTLCPAYETRCPVYDTECPVYQTRCPPGVTQCENTPTQCPMETSCPVMITECPVYETWCTYDETQCPYEQTKCPPRNPTGSCDPPPVPPWDQVIMSDKEAGIRLPSVRAECPAIKVKCPTVIDKKLLSKSL